VCLMHKSLVVLSVFLGVSIIESRGIAVENIAAYACTQDQSTDIFWHNECVKSHYEFFAATDFPALGYKTLAIPTDTGFSWQDRAVGFTAEEVRETHAIEVLTTMVFNLHAPLPVYENVQGAKLRCVSQYTHDTHEDKALFYEDWVQTTQSVFPQWSQYEFRHHMERLFSNPNAYFLLVYKGQTPVASAVLFNHKSYVGIYCFGVIPSVRKQGVASWMLGEWMRVLQEKNINTIVLHATLSGEPLYKKMGFSEVGSMALLRNDDRY
jgi:ribosomal protein S18 acetylase RimI-like enzyme